MNTTTTDTLGSTTGTHTDLLAVMSFGAPELISEQYAQACALEYVLATDSCTLCLVDDEDPTAEAAELAALPACPCCGVRSVEWRLALEIEERVDALAGLVALDRAVAELDD